MVATDGVYFRSRHPSLTIGKNIGEWEESGKVNLTLFKPGVYWDDKTREHIRNGEAPQFKSRGVSAKALASEIAKIDRVFSTWTPDGANEWPRVRFKVAFSMLTLRQALQGKYGRKWSQAGSVTDDKKLIQDSIPVGKRGTFVQYEAKRRMYRSTPMGNGGEIESTPYARTFGFNYEREYEFGDSPDGSVLSTFRHALGVG
jgi:hypothetical protein